MKAKSFKGANVIFAKDQPEYNQLPAFRGKSNEGIVITCWSLSFFDKIRALFFGEIWLQEMTFNNPLHPKCMSTKKPIIPNE